MRMAHRLVGSGAGKLELLSPPTSTKPAWEYTLNGSKYLWNTNIPTYLNWRSNAVYDPDFYNDGGRSQYYVKNPTVDQTTGLYMFTSYDGKGRVCCARTEQFIDLTKYKRVRIKYDQWLLGNNGQFPLVIVSFAAAGASGDEWLWHSEDNYTVDYSEYRINIKRNSVTPDPGEGSGELIYRFTDEDLAKIESKKLFRVYVQVQRVNDKWTHEWDSYSNFYIRSITLE